MSAPAMHRKTQEPVSTLWISPQPDLAAGLLLHPQGVPNFPSIAAHRRYAFVHNPCAVSALSCPPTAVYSNHPRKEQS